MAYRFRLNTPYSCWEKEERKEKKDWACRYFFKKSYQRLVKSVIVRKGLERF